MVNQETPYGPLITKFSLPNAQGGDDIDIGLQNPMAMLWYVTKHSDDFAELMASTLASCPPGPSNPWRIILYQDGVDPSDGLSKQHSRKSFVFYWSILEFGYQMLACEQVWLTGSVIRDTQLKLVRGGLTGVAEKLLERFFGYDGFDIEIAGVALDLPNGSHHVVHARLGVIVGDEPALKELLDSKGHAGVKPCSLCQDIVMHKASGGVMGIHGSCDFAKSLAKTNVSAAKRHTDQSIRDMLANLRARPARALCRVSFRKGYCYPCRGGS